jgi:hypothetical protein
MRESYHVTISQESLQRNWSLFREKRHRKYATTDRVTIVCVRCRTNMGHVVAFKCEDTYGIVEDTATWTLERSARPAVLTGEGRKHPPWLWVEGDMRKARAHLRCPGCRRDTTRNAHRLGQGIVEQELTEISVK